MVVLEVLVTDGSMQGTAENTGSAALLLTGCRCPRVASSLSIQQGMVQMFDVYETGCTSQITLDV